MEERWLGDPSHTIAGETPLLCIILNSPAAIQRQAFMLVKLFFFFLRWLPVGFRGESSLAVL